MIDWSQVWSRLSQGRHCAAVGVRQLPTTSPGPVQLVVVDCEFFRQPRGVLAEAHRALERLLGAPANPLLEAARRRLESGLRRHLIGETDEDADLRRLLELYRSSKQTLNQPVALVFRSVDRADPDALRLLASLIARRGTAVPPFLLCFDQPRPPEPAAALVEAITARIGPEGVFSVHGGPEPSEGPAAGEAAPRASDTPPPAEGGSASRERGSAGGGATSRAAAAAPENPRREPAQASSEPAGGGGGASLPEEPADASPRGRESLPPASLLVLRAAATAGARFDTNVVAALLGLDELAVLGHLQQAVDCGLALEDRGDRRFRMPAELLAELRSTTLPSLQRAWHERLAQLLGGARPGPGRGHGAPPPPGRGAGEPAPAPVESNPQVDAEGSMGAAAAPPQASAAAETPPPARDLLEVGASSARLQEARSEPWFQQLERSMREHARPPGGATEPERPRPPEPMREFHSAPRDRSPSPAEPERDARRAARHAEAAGQWQVACEQHVAAAQLACDSSLYRDALQHAERALELCERVPREDTRRQLAAAALALIGRVRWRTLGPGTEFSLEGALEPLEGARKLLRREDPPGLHAEVAGLIANVCYDVGTPEALERALTELTQASQGLLAAGLPLEAARLLNDEAAVWVKLGDPVRANRLLSRSREVFSKVALTFPPARLELAETEHLLARLMLQARARPGREREAFRLGFEHAQVAEEVYGELGDNHHLGRVQETLGRLELGLGHLEAAEKRLAKARRIQEELGDGVGLARTSAALGELLATSGNAPAALQLLAESIEFNLEKGSRAGLAFNLQSLREMSTRLPPALHAAARDLERRLVAGLSVPTRH